ncbi:hypothetical protein F5Y07DRAFT_306202 [Xylaria sp. FL0933]|nr:hypothetical protein F5Y07DRAFT_306202 [Xylaria sp. FL0933]
MRCSAFVRISAKGSGNGSEILDPRIVMIGNVGNATIRPYTTTAGRKHPQPERLVRSDCMFSLHYWAYSSGSLNPTLDMSSPWACYQCRSDKTTPSCRKCIRHTEDCHYPSTSQKPGPKLGTTLLSPLLSRICPRVNRRAYVRRLTLNAARELSKAKSLEFPTPHSR